MKSVVAFFIFCACSLSYGVFGYKTANEAYRAALARQQQEDQRRECIAVLKRTGLSDTQAHQRLAIALKHTSCKSLKPFLTQVGVHYQAAENAVDCCQALVDLHDVNEK